MKKGCKARTIRLTDKGQALADELAGIGAKNVYLPIYVLPDTKAQIYAIKKAHGLQHLDDVVRLLLEGDNMPKRKGDIKYCAGCDDDYYNGRGATECWNLKTAQLVQRFRIGWWTRPERPDCFTEVTTNSCHREAGRYAFMTELPAHLKGDKA